ncbi:MAG: hypothetical protein V4629_10515 [Pseudomonadota bacterium]
MHSQPNSVQPSHSSTSAYSSKRRTAIAIFILFALPPLLAFVALKTGWYEKQPLTHHGVLLTPPLNASDLLDEKTITPIASSSQNNTEVDTNIAIADSKKKWLLMTWIPEECADACQSRVIQMGQMIQALGAERARVQTLYVTSQNLISQKSGSEHIFVEQNMPQENILKVTDSHISKSKIITSNQKVFDAPQTITWIQKNQPRAVITQVSENDMEDWLVPVKKELNSEKSFAELDKTQPGLMIVDPMRQAMLYYPSLNSKQEAISQGKNIIRDLQKLLKVSRIG